MNLCKGIHRTHLIKLLQRFARAVCKGTALLACTLLAPDCRQLRRHVLQHSRRLRAQVAQVLVQLAELVRLDDRLLLEAKRRQVQQDRRLKERRA